MPAEFSFSNIHLFFVSNRLRLRNLRASKSRNTLPLGPLGGSDAVAAGEGYSYSSRKSFGPTLRLQIRLDRLGVLANILACRFILLDRQVLREATMLVTFWFTILRQPGIARIKRIEQPGKLSFVSIRLIRGQHWMLETQVIFWVNNGPKLRKS